jgi:hypothetical protein
MLEVFASFFNELETENETVFEVGVIFNDIEIEDETVLGVSFILKQG